MPKTYTTYILANQGRRLYVGVTSDLARRVEQHRSGECHGFTGKYNIDRLVWYEEFSCALDAIAREKEIKGWLRRRKLDLIARTNPMFKDLADGVYG